MLDGIREKNGVHDFLISDVVELTPITTNLLHLQKCCQPCIGSELIAYLNTNHYIMD